MDQQAALLVAIADEFYVDLNPVQVTADQEQCARSALRCHQFAWIVDLCGKLSRGEWIIEAVLKF